MAKINKQRSIISPEAKNLIHQDVIEGIPVKVFAAHWKFIVRVYLHPDGKCIELKIPTKVYLDNTLTQIMTMAIEEAKRFMPANTSLSPKPIQI